MSVLRVLLPLALAWGLLTDPAPPRLEIASFVVEIPTKERKTPLVELKGQALGLPHGTVIRLNVDFEGRPGLQAQVVTEEEAILWRPELKPPELLPGRYRLRAQILLDDQPLRLQKHLEHFNLPEPALAEVKLGDDEQVAAARARVLSACRAILAAQLEALKRMEAWTAGLKPAARDELVKALAEFQQTTWHPDWKAIAVQREALRQQGWLRPFPEAEWHIGTLSDFAGSLLSLRLRGLCEGPGWPLPEGLDSTGPMTLHMAEQRRDLIVSDIQRELQDQAEEKP